MKLNFWKRRRDFIYTDMVLDIIIIIIYLVVINLLGLKYSRAGNIKDYFLGNRNIPWQISCFSIVATETSTLTFLSIPGLAYMKGLGFMQVALGYLIGRVLVAYVLLPRYFSGNLETSYQFLQHRFGTFSRKAISVVFHITRILSDSVRLYATAIPLSLLTGMDYRLSIVIIGMATFIYTCYGGINSVAVVDTFQLAVYLVSAFVGIFVISGIMDLSILSIIERIPADKLAVFSTGLDGGIGGLLGSYNIFSGIIGGALLSFASHGTDHMMVQRVLACRDLRAGKKSMIMSGVIIVFQFMLFLMLGLFLLVLYDNRHFQNPDEVMSFFIINGLPSGLKGLVLAGLFAAAMSTLASVINSLSSSTVMDILNLGERDMPEERKIRISKAISLLWTIVIMGISMLITGGSNPLVEIGLGIASVTYGGILGIFLQGRFIKEINDRAALASVIISIIAVLLVARFMNIFWPWFVPIGFTVSFFSGIFIDRAVKWMRGKRDQS